MIAGKHGNLVTLNRNSPDYPQLLDLRLGNSAPESIDAFGNTEILNLEKTALLCSNRCPGNPIMAALETFRGWREESRCIISGFHSHVEKECLRILLKGDSPLIICPARSIKTMRIPKEWKTPLLDGRLLILSPFPSNLRRPTAKLAQKRNEFVAALADEIYIPWVTSSGHLQQLIKKIPKWNIPIRVNLEN